MTHDGGRYDPYSQQREPWVYPEPVGYQEPPTEYPEPPDDWQYHPGEETWAEAGPRKRWGLVVFASVAASVVLATCGAGVILAKGEDRPAEPVAATTPAQTTATAPLPPSPEPTTPTATAAPTSTRATPSRKPTATEKAPPAPPPEQPGCPPTVTGKAATHAEVRAALKTAAKHTYWRSVPTIKVLERLLIAVAMSESTWRSNVVACDGGIGLMQVMPATVTQINNRFGTTWNVNTLSGNAHLGGNYLAWSVKYLGDLYFGGSYDLRDERLLDAVIAAYNYGAAAIDPTKGAAGIPNRGYVDTVRGYMASCPCDSW